MITLSLKTDKSWVNIRKINTWFFHQIYFHFFFLSIFLGKCKFKNGEGGGVSEIKINLTKPILIKDCVAKCKVKRLKNKNINGVTITRVTKTIPGLGNVDIRELTSSCQCEDRMEVHQQKENCHLITSATG